MQKDPIGKMSSILKCQKTSEEIRMRLENRLSQLETFQKKTFVRKIFFEGLR